MNNRYGEKIIESRKNCIFTESCIKLKEMEQKYKDLKFIANKWKNKSKKLEIKIALYEEKTGVKT